MTTSLILTGILQALLVLLVAPLFSGLARVLRAKMHSRHGPSIFQNYRDLVKLMKRQEVISNQAGWVFRITPYILMATMLLAAMLTPMLTVQSPLGGVGDLITLVYLFVLSRFFFSLSGLDGGNTYAGLGARREMLLSVLIEPVILLTIFVMALIAGSTNLGTISQQVESGAVAYSAAVWLSLLAFAFAAFVEMGKLPFDLAEAEQELQEGPLAEYSGPGLALMKWGLYMKQVVVAALFMAVFVPFGSMTSFSWAWLVPAALLLMVKIVIFYLVIAVLENSMARVRTVSAATFTWVAVGAAVLSFVFYLSNV